MLFGLWMEKMAGVWSYPTILKKVEVEAVVVAVVVVVVMI